MTPKYVLKFVCQAGLTVPVQRCSDMTKDGMCPNNGKECRLVSRTWVKA